MIVDYTESPSHDEHKRKTVALLERLRPCAYELNPGAERAGKGLKEGA